MGDKKQAAKHDLMPNEIITKGIMELAFENSSLFTGVGMDDIFLSKFRKFISAVVPENSAIMITAISKDDVSQPEEIVDDLMVLTLFNDEKKTGLIFHGRNVDKDIIQKKFKKIGACMKDVTMADLIEEGSNDKQSDG